MSCDRGLQDRTRGPSHRPSALPIARAGLPVGRAAALLNLQKAAGNRAVSRLVTATAVQRCDSGSRPNYLSVQRAPSGSAPGPQQPKTPPAPPSPLYDRTPYSAGVEEGLTLKDVTEQLEVEVRKGEIKSFAVAGEKSSANKIFLLALLLSMAKGAKPTRWNIEADIVTDIDWGRPRPRGLVTVRIDHEGAASAELIAAGPLPAVAQVKTFEDGQNEAIALAKFESVRGEGRYWQEKDANRIREISQVVAALKLLKARASQSMSALQGVELIRVPVLTTYPNEAGEFSRGEHAALGAKADSKPYLKLADLAFTSGASNQFSGGGKDQGKDSPTVPPVFEVILHEVGHAVEEEELRQAEEDLVKKHGGVEEARKVREGSSADFETKRKNMKEEIEKSKDKSKKAKDERKRALDELDKEQQAEYNKNTAAEEAASTAEVAAAAKVKGTMDAPTGHTKRLQKFIKLVTDNNIRRFTQHSDYWWQRGKPKEFYAEAYSLWLVDPVFVRTNYKKIYDFFQSGDYLT